MQELISAIDFAAKAHKNQRRKNKTSDPYINHPIEVMTMISNAGVTETVVLMSAVLHDTVEDTDVTLEDITTTFGSKVALVVAEVSDDKSLPKVERKKLQIVYAATASKEAKLVKLADKLSNLKGLLNDPPVSWTPEVVRGYALWSFSAVEALRGTNPILEEELAAIFEGFGITKADPEGLEAYYDTIKE